MYSLSLVWDSGKVSSNELEGEVAMTATVLQCCNGHVCLCSRSFNYCLCSTAATFQVTTPLAVGRRYYVQVRACNPLGLCSQAASDGAILDLTPPTRGRVLDGLVGEELQFQPSP